MFKDKRTAMVGTLVLALFLLSLTLTNPGKALAAYDCFLKVDGIPGESTDDKHKDWIEIFSWSFGETQPASATRSTAGGASAERVKMQDFKFTMKNNKTSPKLFQACAQGEHLKEVKLEVCRATGDKQKFLEIKLENVVVSSFLSLGNSTQTYPMEEISLNFGKIKIIFTQQKRADGSGGGYVEGGWDVETNKKY